ncbi:MAG: family 1 glycosylhydrolase [Steroidobacteraceae bacterium]
MTNVIADDGNIYDTDRIMFLRSCLTQLQRASADGVPVKTTSWIYGYGDRCGLIYVDFKTQTRTPKTSVVWFRKW